MADDYENWTPYAYSFNNLIFFNDPSGLDPETSTAEKPKELAEVVVVSSYKNKWTYSQWADFTDRYKG